MRKVLFSIAVSLSVLAGCVAATQAREVSGDATAAVHSLPERAFVSCSVRKARTPNGVRIEALASAEEAFNAEYDLIITKESQGGASDIQQGGFFSARANELAVLSGAEFGAENPLRGRATLRVFDAGGELCRASRNL